MGSESFTENKNEGEVEIIERERQQQRRRLKEVNKDGVGLGNKARALIKLRCGNLEDANKCWMGKSDKDRVLWKGTRQYETLCFYMSGYKGLV